MVPFRDSQQSRFLPIVTYTLIALNVITFLWDRQLNVLGPPVVFADLGMRPDDLWRSFRIGGDQGPLVTLFTAIFLHANLSHLIFNMLFMLTFGPGIEEALGYRRFALYYVIWGVFAGLTHAFVHMNSNAVVVGASGAIGGILGAYFLLFPTNKIEIVTPLGFFEVSAWILLGLWFLWQIFIPQANVANWAHAGGFLAGMSTVLLMGGRDRVIAGRPLEALDDPAV
ncbi:MAG: rhomboid family intramembrane serine protease [Fimbriimonadales bacterium]